MTMQRFPSSFVLRGAARLAPVLCLALALAGCSLFGLDDNTVRVRATVVDIDTGAPLVNMTAGLYGRNGCSDVFQGGCNKLLLETRTDAEGKFTIDYKVQDDYIFHVLIVNPDERRNRNYAQFVELLEEGKTFENTISLAPQTLD